MLTGSGPPLTLSQPVKGLLFRLSLDPVVVGQVMSYNDPDFSVFWSRGGTPDEPPSNTTLFVGKHVGLPGKLVLSGLSGFGSVIFLVLLELALGFLLNHPPPNSKLLVPIREYYVAADRRIIQYLPTCAYYDEALSYILRPGTCEFANREFNVHVQINSAGLRDDEKSLLAPNVIILGDSHAMGWGVEAHETFAQLIEQRSHLNVLNAGISSYGTAREVKLLERLDTQSLDWLIIQYAANDAGENSQFLESDHVLQPMTKENYEQIVEEHLENIRYYPGKYIHRLLPLLAQSLIIEGATTTFVGREGCALEARHFLEILANDAPINASAHMIVLEVNRLAENDSCFLDALRDDIASNDYPRYIEELVLLDLASALTRDKYLIYDGHMSAQGHQAIADELCQIFKCDG